MPFKPILDADGRPIGRDFGDDAGEAEQESLVDDWPPEYNARTLTLRDCGDHMEYENPEDAELPPPPVASEPVEPVPYSEIVIDARAAIRRDRVFESTAGPPRPKNETGPAGSDQSEGAVSRSPQKARTPCLASKAAANLTRIAENSNVDFSTAENRVRNSDAETAMRDLETMEVRYADILKTRH